MSTPQLSRPHLLLVDDQVENLRVLVEMLRQEQFRISVAFDGAQGYQRAQALKPDLILLDVQMPRLDGFGACRLLKSDPATQHIPILFLTSAGELDNRLEGLRIGGVDYILKPFAAAEVLARLRIHLRPAYPSAAPKNPESLQLEATVDLHTSTKTGSTEPDQVLLIAAKNILDERLQNPPSVADLAQSLGTHEKRLSQTFRKYLNTTVFGYLRQRRLEWAQTLLVSSHLPISSIAEELGFSSSANFATAFREQTGLTPKAFRERANNDTSSIEQ